MGLLRVATTESRLSTTGMVGGLKNDHSSAGDSRTGGRGHRGSRPAEPETTDPLPDGKGDPFSDGRGSGHLRTGHGPILALRTATLTPSPVGIVALHQVGHPVWSAGLLDGLAGERSTL
jgi:hypothetical protein